MSPRHIALAVLVAAVWGVNFVVIHVGLGHFPPFLFGALRFAVVAVPAVFFVGRPRVAFRWVVAVGLTLGVAKFGLLFFAMNAGMPSGLSSLVLQSQAVFTAVFAAVLLRERPPAQRIAGLAVAFAGIGLAAVDRGLNGPVGAFALVILSAAFWGLSNVLTKKAAPADALRWMVWMSAVPVLPLLALSLLFEGPSAAGEAFAALSPAGIGAVLYVGLGSTLFGFMAWSFLLGRYDASAVAPYSLLVPVFGMSSSWLLLGEGVSPLGAGAALLVVLGIGLTALRPGALRPGALRPGMPGTGTPTPGMPGTGTPTPGMPGTGTPSPGVLGSGVLSPGRPDGLLRRRVRPTAGPAAEPPARLG